MCIRDRGSPEGPAEQLTPGHRARLPFVTSRDIPDLTQFVKAYDVRGVVPAQLNTTVARALGRAFAEIVALPDGAATVVVGYDMRPSSPELSACLLYTSRCV